MSFASSIDLISCDDTCRDVNAVNPKFYYILLSFRNFRKVIFVQLHFGIKHDSGFIFWNDGEIRQARNSKFAKCLIRERSSFINTSVNAFREELAKCARD